MAVIIDGIPCLMCGGIFRRITNSHLKRKHDVSIEEYRVLYPDARIMSEEAEKLQGIRIAAYAKSEEGRKVRSEIGKNNKGLQRSDEWKQERSKKYSGSGNPFYNKTHSDETRKKLSAHFQGVSEEEWTEFSSTEMKRQWKSKRAKRWSLEIFERDDFTCGLCNKRGGDLEAHHIVPRREAPERAYDTNNGITLCVPCHRKTFKKEGEYRKGFEKMIERLSSTDRKVL